MKIYDISRLPSQIVLGWDGENNWRPIAFNCSALLAGHPDAVVTLWLLPKGAAQAFPVALERDGGTVTWTPLNEEMTAEHGQLQIVVQDGTDVGKSRVIDYAVHDSLVGGADHPAETPSWAAQVVADVTEAADRAEEAAESIGESIGEQLPGAIADYLEEHPVTVTEIDPTVPSWAKQPQKPTYTAAEVGALPDSYTPPVTSVNGKTGAVVLGASDVHALPDSTVIPSAPLEIPITESDGTYSTTATAEQIRAAKENSIFVFGGEARIKALLWLPFEEGLDLLIGIETFGRTIISVAATVSNNNVSIRVEQTVIPTDTSDLTNGAGFITMDDVPAAVTEQTVSDWGFTKNTGTYSKPTGGIPKSDLASAVQTSLSKADTALQTAPVTSVNNKTGAVTLTAFDVNALPDSTVIPTVPAMATDPDMTDWGTGKIVDAAVLKSGFTLVGGVLSRKANVSDIPTAVSDLTNDSGYQTAQQVQTAIAAIPDELPTVAASDNGKFLRVVNGAWSAQAVPFQTPRVAMTASDTTPALDPNKLYVFPTMASLAPTLNAPSDNTIVNEYHFVFDSGSTATVLTLPATVLQPDGFTVEANMHYEISILEGAMTAQGWAVTST